MTPGASLSTPTHTNPMESPFGFSPPKPVRVINQNMNHSFMNPHPFPPLVRPTNRIPVSPACTTLFVSGLDGSLHQNDLISIFSRSPGFKRLKYGKEGTHCFVEYSDEHASTTAMQSLDNFPIDESNVLRIQYAKSRMGESRDKIDEFDTMY